MARPNLWAEMGNSPRRNSIESYIKQSLLNQLNNKKMKKQLFQASVEYEKPQVELLSFCVERGFEASSTLDDMEEIPGVWGE